MIEKGTMATASINTDFKQTKRKQKLMFDIPPVETLLQDCPFSSIMHNTDSAYHLSIIFTNGITS